MYAYGRVRFNAMCAGGVGILVGLYLDGVAVPGSGQLFAAQGAMNASIPGALAITDGSLLARGEGRGVATISLDEELYEPARTQRRRQAAGR